MTITTTLRVQRRKLIKFTNKTPIPWSCCKIILSLCSMQSTDAVRATRVWLEHMNDKRLLRREIERDRTHIITLGRIN